MNISRLGLSEGAVLAAVPVVGYWIAYLFEIGFCNYFRVPLDFVEVGISAIFAATLSLITLIFSLGLLSDTVGQALCQWVPPEIWPTLRRTLMVFVVLLGMVSASNAPFSTLALYLLFGIIPFIYKDWIAPLFSHRHVNGYFNKVQAAHHDDLDVDTPTDRFVETVGYPVAALVFGLYLFSTLAYSAGGLSARLKNEFIVIPGTPEKIVLKRYKDDFVAAVFDRDSGTVKRTFSIVPASNEIGLFKVERLSKVHPEAF